MSPTEILIQLLNEHPEQIDFALQLVLDEQLPIGDLR